MEFGGFIVVRCCFDCYGYLMIVLRFDCIELRIVFGLVVLSDLSCELKLVMIFVDLVWFGGNCVYFVLVRNGFRVLFVVV